MTEKPNYLKAAINEEEKEISNAELYNNLYEVNADPDDYDDYGNAYDDEEDNEYVYADYSCVDSNTWDTFTSARDYFNSLENNLLNIEREIPLGIKWINLSEATQTEIINYLINIEERVKHLHYVTENYTC